MLEVGGGRVLRRTAWSKFFGRYSWIFVFQGRYLVYKKYTVYGFPLIFCSVFDNSLVFDVDWCKQKLGSSNVIVFKMQFFPLFCLVWHWSPLWKLAQKCLVARTHKWAEEDWTKYSQINICKVQSPLLVTLCFLKNLMLWNGFGINR